MLQAYLDESVMGDNKNARVFTVAACLAPDVQWRKFNKSWRTVLKEQNLEYFHMTDYESRQGPYKKWSQNRRVAVLKSLHKIMRERISVFISVSFCLSDYESLQSDTLVGPYAFALHGCFLQINKWRQSTGATAPIEFIFETGSGHGNDIRCVCERIGASVAFADKSRYPLHAADILAFESNKETENYKIREGNPGKPFRLSASHLIKGRTEYCVHMPKRNLEKAVLNFMTWLHEDS